MEVALNALRRQLKQQRRQLSQTQQQQAAKAMAKRLSQQRIWRSARHIALYWPIRGEVDARLLKRYALARQHFYLPVLSPFKDKRLWFIEWSTRTSFKANRFGIPEPLIQPRLLRAARHLDLVITPLVACNWQGVRLGMGGGYYDRSFAFKRQQRQPHKPWLLGYAYDFQIIPALNAQAWDVRLDYVLTEQNLVLTSSSIY
jgi:5-formyltetrahydrofolate cyclo-ligase